MWSSIGPCHNSHIFLASIFDALSSWGLAHPGGTVPLMVSQFLEIVKGFLTKRALYKATKAHTLNHFPCQAFIHRAAIYLLQSPEGQLPDNQGQLPWPRPHQKYSRTCHAVTQLCLAVCDPHGLQHIRLPWPSLFYGICSNSYPLNQWCHPVISSSVPPFLPALSLSQY